MSIFINGVEQVGSGACLICDTTPQLGANLDTNSFDITGVGHIGFLACQDASAGVNDLDDYEEGTFTPVLWDSTLGSCGAENVVHTVQTGIYTKIGNRVLIAINLVTSSIGCLTVCQLVRIGGLPFVTSCGTIATLAVGFSSGLAINATESPAAHLGANVSHLELYLWDGTAGTSDFLVSEWSANGRLELGGHYGV